jgi:hypothetical protein
MGDYRMSVETPSLSQAPTHTAAPAAVVEACAAGNDEWPRLYCGYIIRGGRLALDQLVSGELDFATLQQGRLTPDQREYMFARAEAAHANYRIPLYRVQPGDGLDMYFTPGFISPHMMDELYRRGLRGILSLLETMANFVVHDFPTFDEKCDQAYQRAICGELLTAPQYAARVACLQNIWRTTEAVLDTRYMRQVSTRLRLMQRYVPAGPRQEQEAHRRTAAAGASVLLLKAVRASIEPLRSQAQAAYGGYTGHDVIDYFPFGAVLEGGDVPTVAEELL